MFILHKRDICYSSDTASVFHKTKPNRTSDIFILSDLIVLPRIIVKWLSTAMSIST